MEMGASASLATTVTSIEAEAPTPSVAVTVITPRPVAASDASVATVSDGVVTAKKAGSATITAKAGDKTATCTITVVATGSHEGITEEDW